MAPAVALAAPGPNPFGRAWRAYNASLQRRPVLTQSVTSAVLWGAGDVLGQHISSHLGASKRPPSARRPRHEPPPFDLRRAALTAAFGCAVVGPVGSLWYAWLDRVVGATLGGSAGAQIAVKVAADAVLYTPLYMSAFFAYGYGVVDGLGANEAMGRVVREVPSSVAASACLWPPVMAIVFGRVAVQHQLLVVNLLTTLEVAALSWLRTAAAKDTVRAAKAAVGRVIPGIMRSRRRQVLPARPQPVRLALEPGAGGQLVPAPQAALSMVSLGMDAGPGGGSLGLSLGNTLGAGMPTTGGVGGHDSSDTDSTDGEMSPRYSRTGGMFGSRMLRRCDARRFSTSTGGL